MVLRKDKTEALVGLFVIVGLLIMGVLIVQFGRFGDRMRDKYELTLLFPDGGDITKGSPVRLGGAQVGTVGDNPDLNDDSTGVIIRLEIFDGKRIPADSRFGVATSGLMGDSYIDISIPKEPTGEFIEPGAVIDGVTSGSLAEITAQGGDLLDDLIKAVADIRVAVASLDASFKKVDEDVLSQANLDNLSSTLADFKATGENVKIASEKLIPAVEKGDEAMAKAKEAVEGIKEAVASAKETFDTATEIVEKAGPAVEDFGPTVAELREAVAGINEAVSKITDGDGTAAALIGDTELRRNLESFIANLNEHGVLSYKNDAAKREAKARKESERLKSEENPAQGADGSPNSKSGWWPFRR